jgi:hypothetical protein
LLHTLQTLAERANQNADEVDRKRSTGHESGADFCEGRAEAYREAFDLVRRSV